MRTFLLAVAFVGSVGSAAAQTEYWTDIGFTALQARLGAATPTGSGIAVSQVEAYFPDYLPTVAGKTYYDRSGVGMANTGHPTDVGRYFYGERSIAQGITDVNVYGTAGSTTATGDWFGKGYLHTNDTANLPDAPVGPTPRVQNFSFAGSGPNDALRRLDLAIARDNFVAVVGVSNGAGSAVPGILSGGYNSIAVGLTDATNLAGTSGGGSSYGPTTTANEGTGRSKPDIVVPLGQTSYATPVVGAAAALLLNVANAKTGSEATNAGKAETIKAVLLSGATTQEFADWKRDPFTTGGTTLRPLDARYGAGELNINNSHLILSTTQANGTDQVVDGQYGWDHATLSMATTADKTRTYYLEVPADAPGGQLTATVAWNRKFPNISSVSNQINNPALSTVFLKVYEADRNTFTLDTAGLTEAHQSVSTIDNVQHVNATDLRTGGLYAIEVSLSALGAGLSSDDFAVAWRLEPVPEPAGVLAVAALAVVGYVRRRGGSANRR